MVDTTHCAHLRDDKAEAQFWGSANCPKSPPEVMNKDFNPGISPEPWCLSSAAPALGAGEESDLADMSGLEGYWLYHLLLASLDFREWPQTHQVPRSHVGVRDSGVCGYILCSRPQVSSRKGIDVTLRVLQNHFVHLFLLFTSSLRLKL